MNTTPTASPELLDLDKLEALAGAATAGPWLHRCDPDNPIGAQHCVKLAGESGAWVCDCIDNADCSTVGGIAGERNASFIAGANPAAVLALIALARRAQPRSTGPDALDAARWRALLGSGRIRPLGSAGLNEPMPNNYAHMGLEIWTTGDWSDCSPALAKRLAYDQEIGIDWLTKYADIARAAQLDGGQEGSGS